MAPGPLVKARWLADEGDAELVLYDDGQLKVRSDGLEYEVSSPWDAGDEEPSDPATGAE
jgi:hypothetical protein